jgi:polysaccharide biosynthesis/export protein
MKNESSLMRAILINVAAFVCVFCAVAARGAQQSKQQQPQFQPTSQPAAPPGSPRTLASADEDYRIGPSDVIEITVEDAPELTKTVRITSAGSFMMPEIGRVMALNKTTEELEKFIADSLRGDYLKNPRVTVTVKQINSRSFFIQGSVRRPDVYQVEGKPSLLELITVAGGLADNHGSNALVIRKVKPGAAVDEAGISLDAPDDKEAGAAGDTEAGSDTKYKFLRVNIIKLLRGNFDENMFLEPGDIINIPASDVFFVAGEVYGPGSFPLKEGTTLRQAVSLAQGMTFEAAKSRGIIFRDDPSGKRQEIHVDIAAVMSGKKEDVPILANDIIIVPNSRFKSVSGALLRALGANSARVPMRY